MRNLDFVGRSLDNYVCGNRELCELVKEEVLDSQCVLSCNAVVLVNVSSFSTLVRELELVGVSH